MVILENKHEYIFDTMTELQKYFHLKPRLIRKYRDTNIKISLLDLNENNEILKNALIKIIK